MYEKHIQDLKFKCDAAIALMRAAEPLDPASEREHCERALGDLEHGYGHVDVLMSERAAARAEAEAKYQAMLAPKDESAEREHCEKACLGAPLKEVSNLRSFTRWLENQRAAARAEGYAAASDLRLADQAARAAAEANLAEARSFIQTLSENEARFRADINRLTMFARRAARELKWTIDFSVENDLEAKLTAANARIAELEDKYRAKDELWRSLSDANVELMSGLNVLVAKRTESLETKLAELRAAVYAAADNINNDEVQAELLAAAEASKK